MEGEELETSGAQGESMGIRRRSNPPLFFFGCWLLSVIVGLGCRADAFSLLPTGGLRRPGMMFLLGKTCVLKSWFGLLLLSAELLVTGWLLG